MAKVRELRSLIYKQYDSESELAKRLGWPRQKLSKITNGTKEPDIYELGCLAKGLNQSVDEIAKIFLRFMSPNRQQSNSSPTQVKN